MAAEWSTNYSNLSATCHTCTYSCIISLHPTQENGQVGWHSSPQPGIHCSNTETVAPPMPFKWHCDILQAKIWVLVLFPDKPCNLLMKASPTTKLPSAFPLPWHHLDQEEVCKVMERGKWAIEQWISAGEHQGQLPTCSGIQDLTGLHNHHNICSITRPQGSNYKGIC